jgi:hypothetical protein
MVGTSRADVDILVARSAELKWELLEFSRRPRFDRAFQEAMAAAGVGPVVTDEQRLTMVIDHFLLQFRLRNGRTVVEEFVAARPDLPEAEREMLLSWRDVVEGVFEVRRRDGAALVLENLIDELTYRVRSNTGTAVFRQMPRRSYVITRLVPVGDEWLISGATSVFPARYRAELHRAAAEQAVRSPELGFRNPDKLARAWELQRADRDRFIRFFGSDLVVLAGEEINDRLRAFREFCHREITAGLAGRVPDPIVEFGVDSELAEAESVALIYDEEGGLGYYAEFGVVEEAFADPSLLRRRLFRERVLDYLDDDSVPPHVFRRLAARDAARASAVFRTLLRRPGFDWARDGEALLRERKKPYFVRPPRPSTSVIGQRLLPHLPLAGPPAR